MNTNQIKLQTGGLTFSALQSGEGNEPTVLFLHGFPDSPETFRPQIDPMVAAGYRVIAPTLRGYEPSSQPANNDYSLMAFSDDVIGWLDDLDVDAAHIVGHDWGAPTAYLTAARFPDRVTSLTTIAVPPLPRIPAAVRKVPRQLLRSWYMTFFQLPGLSERVLRAREWWLCTYLWRSWSPGYTLPGSHWDEVRNRFAKPGVVAAALAYYRQNATPPILLGLRSTAAMRQTGVAVPTLIINGKDDGCMDHRLYGASILADDYSATIRHVTIEDAGHFVHLEQPDVVNELLLNHISG